MADTDIPRLSDSGGLRPLLRPMALLWGALLVGFIIETLLYGQPLAVGFACASGVAVAGWILLGRTQNLKPTRSALVLLAAAACLGLFVFVRASVTLRVLDVLAGIALMLLVPAVYVPGALRRLSLADYVVELVVAGFAILGQPLLFLVNDLLPHRRAAPAVGRSAAALPVLRGVLLALPVLLLFGALFFAADPVFASYVRQFLAWDIDLADLLGRLMLALVLAWAALGLARYAFLRPADGAPGVQMARPEALRVGAVEAATAVGLLNLLFAAFVAVQALYLFGGLNTLARTALTYSEYARRGFFELVWVAALVAALILLVDWLARPRAGRAAVVIMVLHILLVALTLAILVSAVMRMRLYQLEYGLTELRFYTSVFMAWIALVFGWLLVTVVTRPAAAFAVPGRRIFAAGAVLSGLAFLIALNIVNPDALIARANLARADLYPGRFDSRYLTDNLSADAVPTLVQSLPLIAGRCERGGLARNLERAGRDLEEELRSRRWNGTNLGEVWAVWALRAGGPAIEAAAAECR